MAVRYYKLVPSDLRIEGHTHYEGEQDMERCPACNPAIPNSMEKCIRTGKPTTPVQIALVEEDPLGTNIVCVYYREQRQERPASSLPDDYMSNDDGPWTVTTTGPDGSWRGRTT